LEFEITYFIQDFEIEKYHFLNPVLIFFVNIKIEINLQVQL